MTRTNIIYLLVHFLFSVTHTHTHINISFTIFIKKNMNVFLLVVIYSFSVGVLYADFGIVEQTPTQHVAVNMTQVSIQSN